MPGGQIMLSANLAEGVILIPFPPPKSSHQNRPRANPPTGLTIPLIEIRRGFPCPDFGLWRLSLQVASLSLAKRREPTVHSALSSLRRRSSCPAILLERSWS